jgi:VanZ family protein
LTLQALARAWDWPVLRIGAALVWTLIVLALTTLPGDTAVVDNTSKAFGGTDVSDAIGHVVLAGILTLLYYAVAVLHRKPRPALYIAVAGALVLTTSTEFAQLFIPHRGASLLDLSANWLGVCSFLLWMRYTHFPRRAV